MNVIDLSNLYSLSLDDLLKGDDKMIEHLEENTNIVKSNRKLIAAIMINVLLVILLVAFNMFPVSYTHLVWQRWNLSGTGSV